MGDLGRGAPRVLRGLALASGCLGLPLVGHALADGSLPDPGAFVFVAALLCGMCVALADRRRGLAEIAVVVTVSQPVLHVLLVLSGHSGGPLWRGGWAMVGAHAVAAVAVTVLLAGAERVLWALAGLGLRLLAPYRIALPVRPSGPHVATVRADAPTPAVALLLRHALRRRGPPAVVAA